MRSMKPKFSLVIPVAPNRDAEILDSIKNLNYPKEKFEVIVKKGKNPSENRNRGAEEAKGEIIAFLDDDAVLPRNYLRKAEKFFRNYNRKIVGGPQLTPPDDKNFARISSYSLQSVFGGFSIRNRYKKGKLNLNADEKSITSANLLCKKEVLDKIKFNPNLFPGEDPNFINSCKKEGYKIAYFPEIMLYHRRRKSLNEFIKQIFNYGMNRPKIGGRKSFLDFFFLIPSFFLIYLVVFSLVNFAIFGGSITGFAVAKEIQASPIFLLLFLPLILYFFINILISFVLSIKNKDPMAFFLLPFIFLFLHVSYGMGLLKGLVRGKFK